MKISIDRLRRVTNQREAAYAVERAAWQVVLSARKDVAHARTALNKYEYPEVGTHIPNAEERAGGWTGGKPGKGVFRPPTPDHEGNARTALREAEKALKIAEAHHDRASDESKLKNSLARRGYNFARNHISIPSDIAESFN